MTRGCYSRSSAKSNTIWVATGWPERRPAALSKLVLKVEKVPVVKDQWQAHTHIILGEEWREGDTVMFSPECRTAGEVIAYADDLIQLLEAIKKKARRMAWDNHPSRRAG